MSNKKEFNAFAFIGKRGGIIIKKRFKLFNGDSWMPFNGSISFGGSSPMPIANFKGRWLLTHDKNITKTEAKRLISESLCERY